MSPRNAQGKVETAHTLGNIEFAGDDEPIRSMTAPLDACPFCSSSQISVTQAGLARCIGCQARTPLSVWNTRSINEPHEVFYVQFAPINFCDDGEAIRKWSRTPFEGARMCRVALKECSA